VLLLRVDLFGVKPAAVQLDDIEVVVGHFDQDMDWRRVSRANCAEDVGLALERIFIDCKLFGSVRRSNAKDMCLPLDTGDRCEPPSFEKHGTDDLHGSIFHVASQLRRLTLAWT